MKYKQQTVIDDYNNYEPQTTDYFIKTLKEDWIVFDCGAKSGYFTLIFSELCEKGLIHAFEPVNFDLLKNNLEYYKIKNVIVNQTALGEKTGEIEDDVYGHWATGKPNRKIYDFITIDDYCKNNKIEKLDLIKIDVDSFDFEVLKGSINTLKYLKPLLVVELNYALKVRNQNIEEAKEWVENQNYDYITTLDRENFIFKPKQ